MTANYKLARRRLEKLATIGEFVLSEKAVGYLKEMKEKMPKQTQDTAPFELYEEEERLLRNALTGIRKCANKELHR